MEQYDNLDFLYHDRRRKSPPRFWVGFLSGLISGVALSLLVSFGAWQEEHRPRACESQVFCPHIGQFGAAEGCRKAQEQERPVP